MANYCTSFRFLPLFATEVHLGGGQGKKVLIRESQLDKQGNCPHKESAQFAADPPLALSTTCVEVLELSKFLDVKQWIAFYLGSV